MRKSRIPAFSPSEKLQVIEKVAIDMVLSIRPGQKTRPNHPYGDIFHPEQEAYSEVKASGLSAGAIIRKDQLQRHVDVLEKHDQSYVIVFYKNREWHKGKFRYLPYRNRTRKDLENFLAANVQEIQIAHVTVMRAIYRKRRKKEERMYVMQSGPKTYLKVPPGQIRDLVENPQKLKGFRLNPNDYAVKKELRLARFGGQSIPLTVYEIMLL